MNGSSEARPAGLGARKHPAGAERGSRLETNTLSARIRDEIIAMIASRKLDGGARLNEVHLAQQFGVSRGPVREAARELEGLGYLVSRPRFGFFVVKLDPDEIFDLYEVKDWIERALTADYLRYCPREAMREQKARIAGIDRSNAITCSASVLDFRVNAMALVHNRLLSQQALLVYRRIFVMSTLVMAENVDQRIDRLLASLEAYWQALIDGDGARADEITTSTNAFWRQDVVPRFRQAGSDTNEQEFERQR